MMQCDICQQKERLQLIVIGVDGYYQFMDDDSSTHILCKPCLARVRAAIKEMEEG